MPPGARRNKTLYGLGAARGKLHRYTWIRWGIGIVSTIAVALLPLTGMLKIDLWSGRHAYLGERVGLVEATKAFAFPFLAINVAIVLASRFLGRWLCGFGCPIGNLNRLAEWLRWRRRGKSRVLAALVLWMTCALLAAITFSFWVDWRVFRDGSPGAITLSAVFLGGTTVVLVWTVRRLGMRFCRDICPSGVYFAVLGPTTVTGVEFAHPETCTDCHACEAVCPVDLAPREIAAPPTRSGRGLYPDGLTNHANCLRCGDCVVACEATTGAGDDTPLRLGILAQKDEGTA